MQVFISYSRTEATFAEELARALRGRHVEPWLEAGSAMPSNQDDFHASIERIMAQCDGLIFVVGAASGEDKLQKMEWHSALRVQFDAPIEKPMIPVLIGNAAPPPFLRDRVALRLPAPITDYAGQADAIAGQIAHLVTHPAETIDLEVRARGIAELKIRHRELERYVESLQSEELSAN